jgi:hypothetical protein
MNQISFSEKQHLLGDTVGVPTILEWSLNGQGRESEAHEIEAVQLLNEELCFSLDHLQRDLFTDTEDFRLVLARQIRGLRQSYPGLSFYSPKFCEMVAVFFAINYHPSLYPVVLNCLPRSLDYGRDQ